VPNPKAAKIEPEAVGFAPDSSFALVTIQDSSSVAAIDMTAVVVGQEQGSLTPEQIGDMALKKVVHLPHGFKNSAGALRGVEPDGVSVSPDGTFAIVANETHQTAKHLQGLSVLDLRNGLDAITAQTYSIFDIDPTLLKNTGLTSVPPASTDTYPADANKLPRLDPANVEIVKRNTETIAAFVIERYDPSAAQLAASSDNETRGSVLFLEVSDALNGNFQVIKRVPIGESGSRLEGVDSAQHGRWIFVSISNGGGDKGTVARLELINK
jgi:DNA-binding beta-propeller fold protein YncE